MNSSLYNVVTENQLTEVLSHYNTDFVMSILDTAIQSRFNPNNVLSQPNLVAAWEQNFKQMISEYEGISDAINKILQVREDTYKEIIQRICKEFNLSFTIDENVDWYSAAFYMYDFFIANFNPNLVAFFKNYIFKERSGLYDSMNLANFKKNKDSSTLYGKKTYKDIRLAVINANIGMVVDYICETQIPLFNIMSYVYPNQDLVRYLSTIITDNSGFFNSFYKNILTMSIRPILLTEIRISIQNMAVDRNDISDSNNEDTIDNE